MSISYDDNHYIAVLSNLFMVIIFYMIANMSDNHVDMQLFSRSDRGPYRSRGLFYMTIFSNLIMCTCINKNRYTIEK